jgi:hypothetical protein
MRKGQILLVLAAVVLTACGEGASGALVTPSPSAATSAAQPSAHSPAPSPSPTPPLVFPLTCRLPVKAQTSGTVKRGWVTFPSGSFTLDPSGGSDGSYDWAVNSWLPGMIAPDGLSYVLQADPTAPIVLVDARTGSRKVILSTVGPAPLHSWAPIAYASQGVYLGALDWSGPEGIPKGVPGLWLLDPITRTVRQINSSHYWVGTAGGFAWAMDGPGDVGGTTTKVYRLDLATGETVAWYESKVTIRVLSPTPEGELLVGYGDPDRPALLSAGHVLTPMSWPPGFGGDYGWTIAQPGIWIAEANGVALFAKGFGIRLMAQNPDSGVFFPAGDCR